MHIPNVGKATVDGIVNGVILLTCCAVLSALTGHWPSGHGLRGAAGPNEEFRLGSAAESLPGLTYSDAEATLVLYVRSTCRYCTASMPVFRHLVADVEGSRRARMVVVSPEEPKVLAEYLKANQLTAKLQISFQGKNEVTPTLLLVDSAGRIQRVWMGQLDARGEATIVDALSGR